MAKRKKPIASSARARARKTHAQRHTHPKKARSVSAAPRARSTPKRLRGAKLARGLLRKRTRTAGRGARADRPQPKARKSSRSSATANRKRAPKPQGVVRRNLERELAREREINRNLLRQVDEARRGRSREPEESEDDIDRPTAPREYRSYDDDEGEEETLPFYSTDDFADTDWGDAWDDAYDDVGDEEEDSYEETT
jgi:hypothetical protein